MLRSSIMQVKREIRYQACGIETKEGAMRKGESLASSTQLTCALLFSDPASPFQVVGDVNRHNHKTLNHHTNSVSF